MSRISAASLALILAACPKAEAPQPLPQGPSIRYPVAARGDVVDDYHGTSVPDPYRWMEDPDAPETVAWVQAENELSSAWIGAVPQRQALRDRLEALWNHERYSVPFERGGKVFYLRNDGLQNQSVLFVADGLEAEARALLDPNTLSEDGTVALAGLSVSRDGAHLAYGVSDGGSDWITWRVRDIATGQDTDDLLEWTKFTDATWDAAGEGLYYARYPQPENALEDANRFHKLYYHRLGTPQADDLLVLDNPEAPDWFYEAQLTHNGAWLVAGMSRSTEEKNLVWIRPAGDESAPWTHLVDTWTAEYRLVGMAEDALIFKTTADAPLGRVVAVNPSDPSVWTELIPEGESVIESASLVGDQLIVSYLQDAHTAVRRYGLDGTPLGEVALPGLGTAEGFDGDPDKTRTFYTYSDFTTPGTVFQYDLASGASSVYRTTKVDFDGTPYVTDQVFFTSKDGTQVPMFVVHREDIALDGTNPTLLYGYGGFNVPLTPSFSLRRLPWLELGGVFVVANLRGGGEYGEAWHAAGTLDRKQNVFDDFIGAAEWLIAEGYTRPDRLAIEGGSNGGLLVGATVLQRPDLFGAALPAVGVMDMLRYHLFTIGWAWASDYGTSDDPELFKTLYAYSPVHNAVPATYPAVLVTTGDHDDRVVPAHSFKFTAALQAAQQGPAPILARIETRAGHGAGKPTAMRLDEYADQLAFLVRALHLDLPEDQPLAAE
ncbi:MAG: S9 family peptidase [Deltaproteobacteria bacterium]|nr:S9 family peptidase [Deltaproteobacteria bacterium]